MSDYIGKRIVPKHCGEWDKDTAYEMLCIVLHTESGESYISRCEVPAGVEITDGKYWAVCSRFSQQIQNYMDATEKILEEMAAHLNNQIAVVKSETDTAISQTMDATSEVLEALEVLQSQVDENISASTDADADYAAEVADIRVGVNGEQFVTAGEAIRSQIKSVQEGEIVPLQDVIRMLAYFLDSKGVAGRVVEEKDLIADGCYVSNMDGTLTKLGTADRHTGFFEVDPADCYLYHGYLEGGGRSICVYSDMTEDSFLSALITGHKNDGDVAERTIVMNLPAGAKYMRASCNGRYSSFVIYRLSRQTFSELVEAFASFKESVGLWQEDWETKSAEDDRNREIYLAMLTGRDDTALEAIADNHSLTTDTKVYITDKGLVSSSYAGGKDRITDYIEMVPGQNYLYVGYVVDARCFAFYAEPSEDAFISAIMPGPSRNRKKYVLFTAPEGCAYARFSCVDPEGENPFYLYPVTNATQEELKNELYGFISQTSESISQLNEDTCYKEQTDVFVATSNEELIKGYYLNSRGEPQASTFGDWITDFIPIRPATRYLYTGDFSDARCLCQYDSNKKLIQAVSGTSIGKGTHKTYSFTSASNAYYFRGGCYGGIKASTPVVSLVETRVTLKEKVADVLELVDEINARITGPTPASFESNSMEYLFAVDNASADNAAKRPFYSRRYVQTLYPESFLRQKLPILLNGRRGWNVQSNQANTELVESETMHLTLGGVEGYEDKELSFQLIKTQNAVLSGKAIRYLAIGDSMGGNTIPDRNGQYTVGWNHSAEAKRFALLDGADLGEEADFLCLGTCHYGARAAFSYNGEQYSLKACDEGRGSWTTQNYLRHFAHTTTTASGSGSSFGNRIAWDSLGLGRKIPYGTDYSETSEYEEYTYSEAQRKLIQTTPHGYYHWDYSEELWQYLKSKRPTYFEGLDIFEASEADKSAIDLAMENLLDFPDNPFFDRNTARETGSYAFSLKRYLERYRTLEEDGKTRLTVGSTAGERITDNNIDNIDVCVPTHITIELGENDRWWYPNDPDQTVSDIQLMMQAIHSEYPAIHVGFLTTRMMGVFYPENWNDIAIVREMSVSANAFKYDINEGLTKALGSVDDQAASRCWLIPTYHCHSALSFQQTREDTVLASGEKVIVGATDINHPGCEANATMGYQILGWIYYTLGIGE